MSRKIILFLLMAIFVLSNYSSAQNLILNGGFESGAVSWSGNYSIETTIVQSGTKAGKADSPGFSGATQDLTTVLEPNTLYKLSGWGRMQTPSSAYNQIGIVTTHTTGSDEYHPKLEWTSETTYTYKEGTFVTPPSWQKITARFLKEDGGNIFYGDNIQLVKIADTQAPDKPTGVSAYTKETAITLKWNKSNDNARTVGYEVYRNGTLVGTAPSTYFTVTGLTNNTTYTFTIRAKDQAGNLSVASDALSVKTGTPPADPAHFSVVGTSIKTPSGADFLIKGTNVSGPGWVWGRETTQDADLMKNVWGFNTVRVNMIPSITWMNVNTNLDLIVDAFTSRNMVTILEHHDFTGRYPSGQELEELKSFWVDKAFRYRNNPYVWFNIMNEPGGNAPVTEAWKTSHDAVIKAIREAGANNMIVLDGSQFGQEGGYSDPTYSGILTYGQYFTQNYNNITFAVHVYDSWVNGQTRFENYFDAVLAKGLSIHVGEYGNITSATAPMFNAAIPRNIGRIMWHWDGTDGHRLTEGTSQGGGFEINRTDGTKPTNLSWLGNLIWEDNKGGNLKAYGIDLAVIDIAPDKAQFSTGNQIRFIASIRNMGLKGIAAGSKVKVRFLVNNTEISSATLDAPLDLGKGITAISNPISAPSNSLTVRAEIDAAGSTYGTDANTANNGRTVTVSGVSPTVVGYDLMVTDIAVNSTDSLNFNQTIKISATLKNIGSGATPAGLSKTIAFKVNGEVVQTVIDNTIGLAAGESKTFTSGDWNVSQVKDFQLAAFVSANTTEINQNNNGYYETFVMLKEINLLKNGSFEQDLAYWTNWGQLSVNTDLAFVKKGAKSLKINAGSSGGGGQNVDLEPNSTYRFSAWGRNDVAPAAGTSSDAGVQFTPAGQTEQTKFFLNFIETAWTYKEVVFSTPASLTGSNVFTWKNPTNVNFYLDDVKLVKVELPTLRSPENPSNTVAGLDYKYYEGTGWSVLPNFDALTVAKSGNVTNFDLTPRNRDDNFGFKYMGFISVPTNGDYTFYTSSDDGSKLYIGSTEVVNNDGLHGMQERSGTIGLKAGKHAISVTFFEAGGGEGLTVSYAGPGITKQAIPTSALSRVATVVDNGTGTGLKGEYFNNMTLTGSPALTRTDATVNFEWAGSPATGVNADGFSVRWTGQVEAPVSGSYTFSTISDDGVRLWVNNVQVINNWTDHAPTTNTGTAISLTAGVKYEIKMEFYENTGGATAKLLWAYPGQAQVAIPQTRLYPFSTPGGFSGTYKILARHSNKALDVSNGSSADGANVQQWTDNNSLAQQWVIEATTDGYYKIVNKGSNKVLQVAGSSLSDGANVQQWTYSGATNQQWKLEATTDGYYRLLNLNSGKALDVAEGSSIDGANVHQWAYGGGNNQQWKIDLLSTATTRLGEEQVALAEVSVYPNPAKGTVHLRIQSEVAQQVKLSLTNAQGRSVLSTVKGLQAGENTVSLAVDQLAAGLYFVKVQKGAKQVVKKVIISQ